MIAIILMIFKASPAFLEVIKELFAMADEHGEAVVQAQLKTTFDQLKSAKTIEEKDAALDAVAANLVK